MVLDLLRHAHDRDKPVTNTNTPPLQTPACLIPENQDRLLTCLVEAVYGESFKILCVGT